MQNWFWTHKKIQTAMQGAKIDYALLHGSSHECQAVTLQLKCMFYTNENTRSVKIIMLPKAKFAWSIFACLDIL